MFDRLARALFGRLHSLVHETTPVAFVRRGRNVAISPYVQATHPDRVRLGNDIYIGPHAYFASRGGLTIEDGVIIGPFVHIYTFNHRYEGAEAVPYDGVAVLRPVVIRRNVWVGGNVVIAPGVTIGEGAIIGAGAVVVKDVHELAVVGGNPARVLKSRDKETYERLVREGRVYMRLKAEGCITSSETSAPMPDGDSRAGGVGGSMDEPGPPAGKV